MVTWEVKHAIWIAMVGIHVQLVNPVGMIFVMEMKIVILARQIAVYASLSVEMEAVAMERLVLHAARIAGYAQVAGMVHVMEMKTV